MSQGVEKRLESKGDKEWSLEVLSEKLSSSFAKILDNKFAKEDFLEEDLDQVLDKWKANKKSGCTSSPRVFFFDLRSPCAPLLLRPPPLPPKVFTGFKRRVVAPSSTAILPAESRPAGCAFLDGELVGGVPTCWLRLPRRRSASAITPAATAPSARFHHWAHSTISTRCSFILTEFIGLGGTTYGKHWRWFATSGPQGTGRWCITIYSYSFTCLKYSVIFISGWTGGTKLYQESFPTARG
ncbi:hypothetical protein Cni_G25536 [Canna indica]|uniref:Uncharacterized protein n=1 Tax=Canna indica TaxID=4628 RepID=A0AAQ3L1C2_9LILI|nr:hypothetical protein Cni_G25536 [Canna indica]